jgi:hypothetical protein
MLREHARTKLLAGMKATGSCGCRQRDVDFDGADFAVFKALGQYP